MSTAVNDTLVVVTPVYEDLEAANRLFCELAALFGDKVYIIAVDDGSIHQPVDVAGISIAGLDGVVIRLKRNVGHQRAIAVGLGYVADHLPITERVVVMDSDGEDAPSSIVELIAPLDSDDVDVAVATRKNRVETSTFLAFYAVYKWLFKLFTGRSIAFGNFMAFKPKALRRIVSMQELGIHVAACVLSSKLRIAQCLLDRGARYAGESKMNFSGLALHGFRGLMVFAENVLVRVGTVCAIVAVLSVLGGVIAVILKSLSFATPGWFSIALGILFLVFLQTGTLTLMTLMLTGVVRSSFLIPPDYRRLVEKVDNASKTHSR
jgi:glycosyltransferase involved in cell wall biosynthesis